MQDLIIVDRGVRPPFLTAAIVGSSPAGNEVLPVSQNVRLLEAIAWVVERSRVYGGDVRVRIMAHGAGDGNSAGGFGMWFCRDKLSLSTVPYFSLWRGHVKKIDLLSCGAAYINHGFEGKSGDGNLLCMRLAQFSQAYVRASTAEQLYSFKGATDFGAWEGTVLTYAPSGAVVKVENSPAD